MPSIEQCADDGDGSNTTCAAGSGIGWITGNLNGNKGSYTVGDYIAYRQVLDDLTIGYTYCFGISWDVAKPGTPGEPAVDYIGTFNNTITLADPTIGYAQFNVGSPDDTVIIPPDPALAATMSGQSFTGSQPVGDVLTLWGVQNGTFVFNGYSNDGSVDLNTAFQQSFDFCFEAGDSDVIIAWGGHIADPDDWGSLTRPTGSPYHASTGTKDAFYTSPRTGENDLVCVPDDDGETTHQNIGSQEVQLQLSDPTAVHLADFKAGKDSEALPFAGFTVAATALGVTYLLLLRRRRRRDESVS